jgi:hypothetical protein
MKRLSLVLVLACLACGCKTITYTTDVQVVPSKEAGVYLIKAKVHELRKSLAGNRVRDLYERTMKCVPGLACDLKIDTDKDSGMVLTAFIPKPNEKKQTYCAVKLTADGAVVATVRIQLPRLTAEAGPGLPPLIARPTPPPATTPKTTTPKTTTPKTTTPKTTTPKTTTPKTTTPKTTPPVSLPVHATVKAADTSINFVALDIRGSKIKIKKGDRFNIHRDGKLIALVEVDSVDPTTCSTRIIGTPMHPIKMGDSASKAK